MAKSRPDLALAAELGWHFAGYTGKCHLRYRHAATGKIMFFPNTPSDWRGIRNQMSRLRKFARESVTQITQCSVCQGAECLDSTHQTV